MDDESLISHELADIFGKKPDTWLQRQLKPWTASVGHCHTLEGYLALPREKRYHRNWWILMPYGLEMDLDEEVGEWDKFHGWMRTEHPAQWFFRHVFSGWLSIRRHRWDMFYYEQIQSRLNPRNKWLTKVIGRTWCDKKLLIPNILFASIVHFIEEEKALDEICWESDEGHLKFKQGLVECYQWIKVARPELQTKFDNSYPTKEQRKAVKGMGDAMKKYETLYGNHNRIEQELHDTDVHYMEWIVKNLDYMWT